jgi:rare lipoprotein A
MAGRIPLRLAGLAAALLMAGPAHAETADPRLAFAAAFAPFALTPIEATLDPATGSAATERFAQAPVAKAPARIASDRAPRTGRASFYGAGFAGRPTASGERFNPGALTAAHRTLPFGTLIRVTNPDNGRSVVVRINDRGPFHAGRMIDLSHEAARRIGLVDQGHGMVTLTKP